MKQVKQGILKINSFKISISQLFSAIHLLFHASVFPLSLPRSFVLEETRLISWLWAEVIGHQPQFLSKDTVTHTVLRVSKLVWMIASLTHVCFMYVLYTHTCSVQD